MARRAPPPLPPPPLQHHRSQPALLADVQLLILEQAAADLEAQYRSVLEGGRVDFVPRVARVAGACASPSCEPGLVAPPLLTGCPSSLPRSPVSVCFSSPSPHSTATESVVCPSCSTSTRDSPPLPLPLDLDFHQQETIDLSFRARVSAHSAGPLRSRTCADRHSRPSDRASLSHPNDFGFGYPLLCARSSIIARSPRPQPRHRLSARSTLALRRASRPPALSPAPTSLPHCPH